VRRRGNGGVSGTGRRRARLPRMGVFRDPLVVLLIATAAAIAFFVVATHI
jgi:hypothetical protein